MTGQFCEKALTMLLALGLLFGAVGQGRANADKDEWFAAYTKGRALYEQGKYREALPYYERALALSSKVFGENHENTAYSLNSLALLYEALSQLEKAEPLYRRSLVIFEAQLVEGHF